MAMDFISSKTVVMFKIFVVALGFAQIALASLQVISGATWTASGKNQHVQAHGGGIINVGGTYYWVGENKLGGSAFQSINCYSSTDLVRWTFVGTPLTLQSSGDLGPNRVVERPKIIHNASTGQYVMWMHIDNPSYSEAKVGVATSSSVCGTYTYRGSFQPNGQQSRDIGLFQDTDGSAYLLTEDRANGVRIVRLSNDYLSVSSNVYLWSNLRYEAPAIIKRGSTYYMFASQQSGWSANDNKYCTATSLSGPWSAWANFADSGSNTYNSQTTFILPIGSNTVMYMGDRWLSSNLMASTYVWLPLTISGTSVHMSNLVNWIPNVSSGGAWTNGPTETTPEAESSANSLASGASVISCSGCSGTKAVGNIGGSSNGKLTFNGVSSSASTLTTIRIKYENGDSAQRYGKVTVNGASQTIAFVPSADGNTPGSSTLHVQLNSGSGNTVAFEGVNGGYAADVDRLMVPTT
ncbi:MAG: hypothetical protein Q9227_003062 [Pyrenula ochraceoflavens]